MRYNKHMAARKLDDFDRIMQAKIKALAKVFYGGDVNAALSDINKNLEKQAAAARTEAGSARRPKRTRIKQDGIIAQSDKKGNAIHVE